MPKRSDRAAQSTVRARGRSVSAEEAATAPSGLPGWAVPALYALACVALFPEVIFGQSTLLGMDTQALSYFARSFYTDYVRTEHAFPVWNPLVFGGLPFLDGMHGEIFYPPSLALFFMNPAVFWGWKMVLHIFLAGLFTYLFLRELGLRRELAMFGGLVFMMGADLVSLVYPGGDGKLFVSALAPLAFLLTERACRRRRTSDYALLALGVALLLFTSHMQAAYFALWGITLYALFRLVQFARAEKRPSAAAAHFGIFIVTVVIGVGAAAVQFFPPLGYLRTYSHRTERTNQAANTEEAYRFATSYSLNAEEIASLVVPEFVGDNAASTAHPRGKPNYWGRNPFKGNHEYAGLIPLLLGALLFFKRRSAYTWFFASLAVLTLLYGLGANTPVFRLFYLLPGVRLFRAPSLIIFLYGLSVAALGAFGLQRALEWGQGSEQETRTARRYFWIVAGVFGVLAALAATGTLVQLWRAVLYPGLQRVDALEANLPFMMRGFGLSFVLALALAGIWEGYARRTYGRTAAIALISLLAFMDVYRVSRSFVKSTVLINEGVSQLWTPNETTGFLTQRKQAGEVFRAFDLTGMGGANYLALHGIDQLAGHHGNEIGRYRELVGGDGAENFLPRTPNLPPNPRVLDVTNTQYLVVGGQLASVPADFSEAYRGSQVVVYRKDNVLPRAYLVGRTQVVPDSLGVQALLSGQVDYHTTAMLPEALPASVQIQDNPQGSVQWTERNDASYRLRVQTDKPALLMVLDNYYPMWQAEVDGQPVDVLRANYTFRAVPVPAGQHDVQFRYVPSNARTPAFVSAALLAVLALLGLGQPLLRRLKGTAPA